jgi:glycosyltransferase involved in cell wall biosynthesis
MKISFFSIVIPFYNKEKTLEDCIKSLLNQDFPQDQYEIIAVNNNSSDRSISIIQKYPFIKLAHEKIQNPYTARNTGILNATGIYMVFIDADVEAPKNWLSNIYDSINKNNYDLLIGWHHPAYPIKLLEIHSLLISERIKKAIKEKSPSMVTACAANFIVKKEVFKKEGLFLDNSNSEDMYFSIRCMEKGYNIGFEDNINVKRNDINSINIFLLKNFIYGCSNALDIKHRLPFLGKLKYIFITIKFIFKYFPRGIGLLLFTFSYSLGYALSKSRILKPKSLACLVRNYTKFTNKKESKIS